MKPTQTTSKLVHQFFSFYEKLFPEIPLRAIIRDWAFANYKWITRAQVQREICAMQWEVKDHPFTLRKLKQLQETIA